ncbi:glutathione S-transferase family protein [Pelagibacterium luteolum]|uniref:Glutathione S-transferase n=1 Tax=Pelagibacterium luteolum TaxID=440168 RepID=A0A1G8ABG5_9HYPH|nr:glutathione S-transferase N-terminal domain-containing protein [Pelagibacterium luteolum]SDH18314.1 Glutathione S-transferase [Pelagibacterium luteolum]
MKLFWSSRSPFVRQVMIVAHEQGLERQIELIAETVAMAAPNARVMAHNPLNKIPVLILDNGGVLYDSRVIIDYLDTIAGGVPLIPIGANARLSALRQQALGMGLLDLAVLWRSEMMRPVPQQNQALLKSFAAKFEAGLSVLEGEADELAGTEMTVGHIALATVLAYLDFRFQSLDWRRAHPHAAEFAAILEQRPAFQATRLSDG